MTNGETAMPYWWDGDPNERLWVEIRWIEGIGLDLSCPLVNEDGHADPRYDLVGEVRTDDTVYHWNATEHRFVTWLTGMLDNQVPVKRLNDRA
jgi:hypothetical protein